MPARMTLNVDDYALLWNSVFNVKGVPMLYLPCPVLPDQQGESIDRLPAADLGHVASLNGQTIGNQFFWAINRSQDATFMHDWYSKLGQGGGAEYRYNIGSGTGNVTSYVLNKHEMPDAARRRTSPATEASTSSAPQTRPSRIAFAPART